MDVGLAGMVVVMVEDAVVRVGMFDSENRTWFDRLEMHLVHSIVELVLVMDSPQNAGTIVVVRAVELGYTMVEVVQAVDMGHEHGLPDREVVGKDHDRDTLAWRFGVKEHH